MSEEVDELKEQILKKDAKIRTIEATHEILQEKFEDLEYELKKVKKRLDSSIEETDFLKDQLDTMESKKKIQEKSMKDLEEKLDIMLEKNIKLEEIIKESKKREERGSEREQQLEKENQLLKKKIEELEEMNDYNDLQDTSKESVQDMAEEIIQETSKESVQETAKEIIQETSKEKAKSDVQETLIKDTTETKEDIKNQDINVSKESKKEKMRMKRNSAIIENLPPMKSRKSLFETFQSDKKENLDPPKKSVGSIKNKSSLFEQLAEVESKYAPKTIEDIEKIKDEDLPTLQKSSTWSGSKAKNSPSVKTVNEKCFACGKIVYQTERISADEKVFHKSCIKCSHCNCVLKLGNYASLQGKMYCKPHFKQLFSSKGNYNEGFGEEKITSKWAPSVVQI